MVKLQPSLLPAAVAFSGLSPTARSNPHAGVWRRAGRHPARFRSGPLFGEGLPAEVQPEEGQRYHGASRILYASAARSRRPLRPPDAPLEPEDGALHLRLPLQHPHHRPVADHPAAAPGPGQGARSRRLAAAGSCSSAPSARPPSRSPPPRKRCAQYYVNHRWLGGTLTNWRTVSGSIARLRELEGVLETGGERPHQEGAAAADPRARQAGAVAGRHQGHGRHPRPDVRDRHQQGSASPSRKRAS